MTRKITIGVAVLITLLVGACLLALDKGQPTPLSTESFRVPVLELADTPEEREQGLSGRTSLPADYGMLFVFESKNVYGFWMKDMFIPIDILWLSDDGTVLAIDDSVQPATYPSVFYPPVPVQYVLETAAGAARANGWEVGDRMELPF